MAGYKPTCTYIPHVVYLLCMPAPFHAACVVEEFHTLEDQCSGISTMATPPSGYIGTQFNVTVTNIAWVGRAVLVPTRLDFCGDITLGEAESDGINCTASLSSSLGSAEKDLVSVQCEGNGSHVPSGPAWIVFERNLTFSENCSDRSDDLSPLRLFFANYSGFKVQWRPDRKFSAYRGKRSIQIYV